MYVHAICTCMYVYAIYTCVCRYLYAVFTYMYVCIQYIYVYVRIQYIYMYVCIRYNERTARSILCNLIYWAEFRTNLFPLLHLCRPAISCFYNK